MTRVLFVIPDARHGSTATQLGLLARWLPPERFACRVAVLGTGGPLLRTLTAAGVPVDVLGWTHAWDGRPLWRLRRLAQAFQPDVVHLWRPAALRAWAVAVAGKAAVVFSGVAGCRRLDRWLLGQVDRVIVSGPAEADACLHAGLRADQLMLVPPGADPVGVARPERSEGRGDATTPFTAFRACHPDTPQLVCIGPLEPHKGLYDALWAFDMLRYVYNELRLHVLGTGSERLRLVRFIRTIGAAGQVRFHDQPDDVRPWLDAADVVWVPSRTAGGTYTALEAMAAGRPVVASRLPSLAEVIADGETGVLVPPGDRMSLARQTRLLLDDAGRRRQLGAAGRRHVQRRFAAGAMAQNFVEVYRTLNAA